MQAYSKDDLYNKYLQQQASEAFYEECISAETYLHILQTHPSKLYTPNYFIRIALGLLTAIAVLFSSLLIWLIAGTSNDDGFVILFLFCAVLCYLVLELFVKAKRMYNAGVDNLLMCSAVGFLLSAFLVDGFNYQDIIVSALMFLFCLWLCIRFTDALMAALSFISLYLVVFFCVIKMGAFAKAFAPFAMMLTSGIIYFVINKMMKKPGMLFYHFCCETVLFLSLVALYASANYFLVRELSNEMFHPGLGENDTIPLGWLFIAFTVLIPFAYIIYGIIKKDLLFIRTGLALIAASIFTIRNYYGNYPAEIDMLVIGLIIIAISYALIKYLRTPKRGFSFEKTYHNRRQLENIEALIIAQTFGKKTSASTGFEFGGGSSGGGGVTGNY